MADVFWSGASSTLVTLAGNYVGGVAPSAGDSVYATQPPVNPMATGTMPNLVNFVVTDAYGNNPIGTLSAGLAMGTVTTMTIGARCTFVNVAPGNVTTANLQMPNGCTAYLNGSGTWTTVIVSPGVQVQYGASATFTTVYSTSVSSIHTFAAGSATTTFTGPATVVTLRTITTANLDTGSRATWSGAADSDVINAVGAVIMHQSSVQLGIINLRSGSVLTPMGNPGGTGACTTINVWSDSSAILAAAGATLTGTVVYIGVPRSDGLVGAPA